jgi:hypothetical protein
MNREEAINDLRRVFRDFLLMLEPDCMDCDFAELVAVCTHGVDGFIHHYSREVVRISRLDIVDDLAISEAVERFVESLIEWRESVAYRKHGLAVMNDDTRSFLNEELAQLRRRAARIARALDKLAAIETKYSHPILALSDDLKANQAGRWNRSEIARRFIAKMNPSQRKSFIAKHVTYADAVKTLAKYLENHKSELLYP